MDRETILAEIRRAAEANGGLALGRNRFAKLTGISEGLWLGKYWARWGDAVAEAGLSAGKMSEAYSDEFLLECIACLTLEIGRLPTIAETKMRRTIDKAFPSHGSFDRLGSRSEKIIKLREYVRQHPEYSQVPALLPAEQHSEPVKNDQEGEKVEKGDGHVYILKLGKHYKVGRTFAVPRRHREIALELPEKPDVVHSIQTDDPAGIEAYWHKRFASKQTNGEWFLLDADDVKAFKRRKFM